MSNYNRVILLGRLTRDPELRFTQNNMAICKVGLAVNRKAKDASGEWIEKATFVDVTIFGKRAEAFDKFHRKGASAFFEGRLELDAWYNKATGQKRSKLYVIADSWEFVSGDKQSGNGQAAQKTGSNTVTDYGGGAGDFLGTDDTPF